MRPRAMAAALVAAASLIAGCGSSSSSSSSSATAAGTTPTTSSSSTPTTSGGSPSFANTQNCQQLANLGAKYLQEIQASTSGGKLDLGGILKAEQALADASPPAIHADFELVVHTFANFIATITKLGYKPGVPPTQSQLAGLEAATQQFRQPQLQTAVQHLQTWVRQNCHGVTP